MGWRSTEFIDATYGSCGRIKSVGMIGERIVRIDMRFLLRSKIHKAWVTETNLEYMGSITVDQGLAERAGFWEGEKVLVVSNTTGARLETYLIFGEADSGQICMNGAASHLIAVGEEIIVMGFELTDSEIKPQVILVDRENRFLRSL